MKLAGVTELKRCSKHPFQDRSAAAILDAAGPLLMAYFLEKRCSLSSAKAAQASKQDPCLAGLQGECTASSYGHDLAGEDQVDQTFEAAVRIEALPQGSIQSSEARKVQWCRRIQTHALT